MKIKANLQRPLRLRLVYCRQNIVNSTGDFCGSIRHTRLWQELYPKIQSKKESKLAEDEKREPVLMPHISSHILRHTGCTRLGENNGNPKVMQYVMGHLDAQIIMNVYNHIAKRSHVENEMAKMNLPETVTAVV